MKNRPGLIASIFGRILFLVNLVAVLWLLLCYAAGFVNISYLSIFSLTSPLAIVANALFFIFWFFSAKKLRGILSLLALAFVYKMVLSIFAIHFFDENNTVKSPELVKVMTWNVHVMGMAVYPVDKQAPEEILKIINTESPDILCMPEFCAYNENIKKPFTSRIMKAGGYKEFRFGLDGEASWLRIGLALFSRYPVKNYTSFKVNDIVSCAYCDVELPGKNTTRLVMVHLQSFLLGNGEKHVLHDLKESVDKKSSMDFINKFSRAYQNRARQADTLAGIIAASPYPVVICGDFNDLPASYVYNRLKGKKLTDAFVAKGAGIGRTYNEISPTLRIDHVLYDPSLLAAKGYRCIPNKYSDHNPVIVNFSLVSPAAN